MKTFVYAITKSNKRVYGGLNQTAEIYRIKKNKPCQVATASWCTAGYKGEESEVLSALYKAKEVSKKAFDLDRGYYRWDNGKIEISRIG